MHFIITFIDLIINFDQFCFVEFSLEKYSELEKLNGGKSKILLKLMDDSTYKRVLKKTLNNYHLRESDVNSCSRNLYHELSKHAQGNTEELVITETEHTITEVAAMETVFGALKERGCLSMPIKIFVK